MKKIIYTKFGGPEVLQIAEVPIPVVKETTVLIKVKAVSINPLDWKIRNGEMKLMSGSKFPKDMGIDFSGIVTETGKAVTQYNKGDEVFGILDVFKGEALAEYIVASEKEIAIKPSNVSFEQAAAMPVVGSAALQIFNNLVSLKKGNEILINGASGGIGMFTTQIAKMKGALVTAVVGNSGMQAVKDWGADFAVNYNNEDVLKGSKQYDVVIDLSGKMPFSNAKQIMKHSSVYIHTAPGPKEIISSFFINLFSNKKYKLLMLKPSPQYLAELTGYVESGIKIVVSKTPYIMLQKTNVNWVKLVIGIVLSTVLSLSVHSIMLQEMNVPFPDLSVITTPYKLIIRIFSVFGLLLFWQLADKKIPGSFVKKWAILFLIDAMLTESLFRGPFMDGYCTNSIGYVLVNNIPKLIAIAITCGLVVFTATRINNVFYKFLAAIAIAATFMFAINPLLGTAWKPLMDKIAYMAPTGEWCKLPYGPDVLIPAYISFIEPVLACIVIAMLILNQLSPAKWLKLLLFALLVVTVNYQLLMPLFYVALHKGPFISNLASEGQFTLESIVLAITTGFTWQWSSLVRSTSGKILKK